MKLPAFLIKHGNRDLFLTSLSGKFLNNEICIVADRFTPSHQDGYQREPNEKRFREISSYISATDNEYAETTGPIMTQSIVLNSREKLKCEPIPIKNEESNKKENITLVYLDLSEEVKLWEVDGQHRIGGIRKAINENENINERLFPVVIVNGMNQFEEAVHFWLINDTQKKVPTDLAQRIIAKCDKHAALQDMIVSQGKSWIKRAIEIVDKINAQPSQPWYERIKVPGTTKTKTKRILITQYAFVKSLKPILDKKSYFDLPTDDLVTAIIRYWKAIEKQIPEAFVNPKNYLIQKTSGVYVMHRLMPTIFDNILHKGERITEENILDIIKQVLNDGADWWDNKKGEAAKYGTNNKSINLLIAYFEQEKMPKNIIKQNIL
ncbi:MAG: DGQHR domain-containing protein [Candidatus Eremiobacterota bacterium]